MNTKLLNELYEKYNILNLSFGAIHDKLGDAYEEFCVLILTNKEFLGVLQNGQEINSTEFAIFKSILLKSGIQNIDQIKEIHATTKVPHRASHGNAKTDIIATFVFADGTEYILPISSKQSYVPKVAVAEFDVETICNEVGIDNQRIRELMVKFQVAKSAKGLTESERKELKDGLRPYARNLVRWAITGSPEVNPTEVVFPRLLVKFKIVKPKDRYNICVSRGELHYIAHSVYTVEEYIDLTMHDKNGNIKAGGFGTGLSWTYATGSGGKKIQFKA